MLLVVIENMRQSQVSFLIRAFYTQNNGYCIARKKKEKNTVNRRGVPVGTVRELYILSRRHGVNVITVIIFTIMKNLDNNIRGDKNNSNDDSKSNNSNNIHNNHNDNDNKKT